MAVAVVDFHHPAVDAAAAVTEPSLTTKHEQLLTQKSTLSKMSRDYCIFTIISSNTVESLIKVKNFFVKHLSHPLKISTEKTKANL